MRVKNIHSASIMLVLAILACSKISTPPPASNLFPGETTRTIKVNGVSRSFILYIPATLDVKEPADLVMVFHGGGGKARDAIRLTGFNRLAEEDGFIVVYPNGTGPEEVLTWNGGTCCGNAMLENADDVGFARAILAEMQDVVSIDPKRVFATGMSNGGIMAYRLACEAADIFAAVGSVAGTQNFSPCKPSEPVAIIHFHGTDDQHVPYKGGIGTQAFAGTNFTSVSDTINFWIALNGCNPEPNSDPTGDVRDDIWEGCEANATVELYTIFGGGHVWPGSERLGSSGTNESLSATDLIWEFFANHPKH